MRAIVKEEYGTPEVLKLSEVDRPVVTDDGVLIRVHASSVNAMEWHMMTGTPYLVRPQAGMFKPKQTSIGGDVAGTVEEVGKDVTRFEPGDVVFGDVNGAYADYVSAPERLLANKPANVTFEQAAAVPIAGLTALQGLRDHGKLKSGQKVLIIGASGGVGTFAVQIAKSLGAEVTAVCSTANVETAAALGADHVIDYSKEDFIEGGERFDLVFDVPGNRSLTDCKRILKPGGIYLLVGGPKGRFLGPIPRLLRAGLIFRIGDKKMAWFVAKPITEDLDTLKELLESGEVVPFIEQTYSLEETAAALRRLGEGHARGKLVITV